MRKKRIAFIFVSPHDLSGGGGAERFLCDVFDSYREKEVSQYDLYFVSDEHSIDNLRSVGKLKTNDHVVRLKSSSNKFLNAFLLQFRFLRSIFRYRFHLIHIWLPSARYLPFLSILNMFPRRIRPKVAINVVDCSLSHLYLNPGRYDHYGQLWHYRLYFKFVRLDALFSWYQLFKELFEDGYIVVRGRPKVVSARYCFTNVEHFRPAEEKENIAVFAGRLELLKQPFFFVEAIKIARELRPNLVNGWHFLIFGKGPLEAPIQNKIGQYQLEETVQLGYLPDLAPVFSRSKIFVSTQDYENFTSLSMLEAMASGNAVIARNVGQTQYFVRDGMNGMLLKEDTPHGLATALIKCMEDVDLLQKMQRESRRIAAEVYNPRNFMTDIEDFWRAAVN